MTSTENREWDKMQEEIENLSSKIDNSVMFKKRLARKAEDAAGYHRTDNVQPLSVALTALHNGEARSINDATMPQHIQRALTSVGAGDNIQSPNKTGEYFFTPVQEGTWGSLMMGIDTGVSQNDAIVNFTELPEVSIHAEGTEMPNSTMKSKLLTYILKNLIIRFDLVNNVIRDAVNNWGEILRESFNLSLDHKLTQQVLSGAGSTEITGLDNVVGVQTIDAASATGTWDMILQATQKIIAANGSLEKIGVIMHPAVWLQLQSLKDTTGQQITKPSGLDGMPMVVHTAVGTEYGDGSDETRIYVGDFSTCKLGVGGKYEITSETSKADHDVTQFIMVYRADFQVFHPTRIVRIENVAIV